MEQTVQPPARQFHLKTRALAAGIHLTASAAVLSLLLVVVLLYWMPMPFFVTDGGWQGLRIVVPVDLVLGPTVMFLAFNPRKSRRELTIDIMAIVLVQLAALAYGAHAMYQKRILALVADVRGVHVANADDIAKAEVPLKELRRFGERFPVVLFSQESASTQEAIESLVIALNRSTPEYLQPSRFAPIGEHTAEAFSHALPASALEETPARAAAVKKFVASHGGATTDYRFMRVKGIWGDAVLGFTPKGEFLGGFVDAH